jgi:hypothetical protein
MKNHRRMKPPGAATNFSSVLTVAVAQMNDQQRRLTRELFEFCRVQWTRLTQSGTSPEVIANTVHATIDEPMQRMLATSEHGPEVQCFKGCAHCCHLAVGIFPQEATLLWRVAKADGLRVDEARLARQASKDSKTWHELAPEDRRCVFLDNDRT